MGERKPSYRMLLGIIGSVFVLDQWSKWWALAALTRTFLPADGTELTFGQRIGEFLTHRHPAPYDIVTVVEHFWNFRYAENPGAAWSFMRDAPESIRLPFLLIFALIASGALVWYYRKAENRLTEIALALMLGGAAGNFFDRIRFGYVIDFIDFHWYDRATWPTFNVADIAVVVGVGGLLLEMFKRPQNGDKPAEKTRPTDGAIADAGAEPRP